MLVKKYYNGVKSPSEFADNVLRPRKLKPDANIIQDLIDKL